MKSNALMKYPLQLERKIKLDCESFLTKANFLPSSNLLLAKLKTFVKKLVKAFRAISHCQQWNTINLSVTMITNHGYCYINININRTLCALVMRTLITVIFCLYFSSFPLIDCFPHPMIIKKCHVHYCVESEMNLF